MMFKSLLSTVLLAASINVYSAEVIQPTAGTIMSPFATTGMTGLMSTSSAGNECEILVCKEAATILIDAEAYAQSGELTLFLNQRINELRSEDVELSQEEAVDILVERAKAILN